MGLFCVRRKTAARKLSFCHVVCNTLAAYSFLFATRICTRAFFQVLLFFAFHDVSGKALIFKMFCFCTAKTKPKNARSVFLSWFLSLKRKIFKTQESEGVKGAVLWMS